LGELSHGTVVAMNFGPEGQETIRILGAREPETLFLVGWEVNIQSGQKQEHDQTKKGLDKPTCRWRHVLCYCYHYFVVVIIILLLMLILLC